MTFYSMVCRQKRKDVRTIKMEKPIGIGLAPPPWAARPTSCLSTTTAPWAAAARATSMGLFRASPSVSIMVKHSK